MKGIEACEIRALTTEANDDCQKGLFVSNAVQKYQKSKLEKACLRAKGTKICTVDGDPAVLNHCCALSVG